MKKIFSIILVVVLLITSAATAVTVQAAGYVLGDVNNDGIVSISDVTVIQRHLAELEQITEERLKAAMVNDGKTLTITDATTIQKKLAEMIDEFPVEQAKTIVVYFSRTGHTKPLALYAAEYLEADTFEIEAAIPYTDEDIAYYTNCRADREQSDPTARPEIANTVENMAHYDTIILAYPIWHGQAPKIIYTFLESYDFSGKTIIPFCTSASSGIGSSATNLHTLAPDAVWKDGKRFAIGTSQATIEEWLASLK